jgi:ABC-type amino acid transport substrate-binding protein
MRMGASEGTGGSRGVVAIVGLLCVLAAGCSTQRKPPPRPPAPPLRVGIAPDYPPLIFKRGEEIMGVEADLARELAKGLGRPLKFVELEFEELIRALVDGRIDIIMSGMSITDARKVRIKFSDPYLNNGLLAMMRVESADEFSSPERIKQSVADIGVKQGTTGEAFVTKHCPRATVVPLLRPSDAAYELRRRRIDLFIHDGYAVAWLVSENEAEFTALWTPLTEEYLAWGLRHGATEFQASVNRLLARWKEDGVLTAIVGRWLPYMVAGSSRTVVAGTSRGIVAGTSRGIVAGTSRGIVAGTSRTLVGAAVGSGRLIDSAPSYVLLTGGQTAR